MLFSSHTLLSASYVFSPVKWCFFTILSSHTYLGLPVVLCHEKRVCQLVVGGRALFMSRKAEEQDVAGKSWQILYLSAMIRRILTLIFKSIFDTFNI